ncbi:MAG: DUF1835 domain-containing protein [Lutibacter sp.]|uniref:DUF1835 domain-containing protein n=1 Tax=Lutibacter sp. TaxID=1925666 RepID=UPI001829AB0C|nr:DUF1835 domain-containing protein [Lutibacter sp.]MBT8318444.1 DUF1835 domain-containing protein [Lutibacter sp.]NNJ59302.1 DUF1835 domain-containing protein [Lutibacter sp.]
MSKTIHVLNGDSTAQVLEKSKIEGDVIIWREMLCEGPVHKSVGSDEFWINRYSFFEEELRISRLEYYDTTIKEIVKLEDLSGYEEVVLWFEYDLFCQVNLMALCTYLLANYVKKANYYLICTGEVKGKNKLQSLTDFKPSGFETLYETKIALSKTNLEFAKESWELYVENDFKKLDEFNFNKSAKFKYLQAAINQHLLLFPSKNGLNQISTKIFEILKSNALSKEEIINTLLIWQQKETVYGFGDVQYNLYINKLKKYFTIDDNKYYLNEKGLAKINQ